MATMHVHMTQFSAPYIITCYIGIRNTYLLLDFEDKELVRHWLYCFTAGSKITTALLSVTRITVLTIVTCLMKY